MRTVVLILALASCGLAQSHSAALERQRISVERQRERVESRAAAGSAQAESVARQLKSVERQRESARSGGVWDWSAPASALIETAMAAARCKPSGSLFYDGLIQRQAKESGLSAELLNAVVKKESSYNPCAVSPVGAMGLMQLMPSTAAMMGVDDPFDPEQNVRGGSRFLKWLLDRYSGDVSLALGAYNAGPGRVDRAGGVPMIPETLNYVRTIMNTLGAPVASQPAEASAGTLDPP